MSILGKVKKLVGAEEEAHTHDHAGHDHDDHAHAAENSAPLGQRPASAEGAVGNGAAKFIVRPLVSEKGTHTAEHNTHLFEVQLTANKRAIREAIEKIYGVKVTKVRTSRIDGKKVRSGKVKGQRSHFKKAFVTLAKGETIAFFKGV